MLLKLVSITFNNMAQTPKKVDVVIKFVAIQSRIFHPIVKFMLSCVSSKHSTAVPEGYVGLRAIASACQNMKSHFMAKHYNKQKVAI